jgi:hypothetical protein
MITYAKQVLTQGKRINTKYYSIHSGLIPTLLLQGEGLYIPTYFILDCLKQEADGSLIVRVVYPNLF